jgi:hypothetical protein
MVTVSEHSTEIYIKSQPIILIPFYKNVSTITLKTSSSRYASEIWKTFPILLQ